MLKEILEVEAKIRTDPFNPIHHIALARAYLEGGSEEKARKVIATKRRLPSKDPSIHFAWAELCEELGMARQAIESYEQAIALNPQNSEYHFKIALLYYEKGAWEKALKHLQKTVSLCSQHQEAKEMLASLYEEMGFKGLSEKIKGEKEKDVQTPKTIYFELQKEDAFTFINLFQGREFGYAKYQIDNLGHLKPVYMDGSLGYDQISKHIIGEETLGVYPLRSDNTLKFSAIKVHIPRRRLLMNIKNEGFLAISEDHVHYYAKRIYLTIKDCGLPVYLENSGGYERRVWFFFEEFIPYELSERFLNHVLDRVSSPGMDLSIRLLLGYQGAGIGWVDEPILLPLGFNPETKKRCFFIDEEGNPFENQIVFLHKIRRIESVEIQSFFKIGKVHRPLHVHSLDLLKKLENNCPVLSEIIWKARSGRKLENDEKLVIFFIIGFLPEGEKILHEILEPCPDYRPHKVKKMFLKVKGRPMSCPKIRKIMPQRTAYLRCNCSFEIPEGCYPSPLLHVRSKF